MANLLLTQRCVRSCPYCFAGKKMADSDPGAYIGWEDVVYIADLIVDSGRPPVISLLGGEPTLHPEFVDLVGYFAMRGFHVQIFTSGIMSEKKISDLSDVLSTIPVEMVNFTCNVNDPRLSPEDEQPQISRFLEEFGERVTPGFNIYRPDFSLDFIFDYINRFGLQRSIRLGIANPIFNHDNVFISPSGIKGIAEQLASFFPRFERERVRPGLDCGFPLCMFTNGQLGELFKLSRTELHFGCGPAIDIGPDASVWACFPLSSYEKKSIYEFDSINDVYNFYQDVFKNIRIEVSGIYPECDTCIHREVGLCSGGCVAHALNAMLPEPNIRALVVSPS